MAESPAARPRRRYRRNLPLLLISGATLLIGVGALNSQNNLLFIVFGLSVGAILVSGFFSGSMMMSVRVRRAVPPPAQVGVPWRLTYEIEHAGGWAPVVALVLEEEGLSPVPNDATRAGTGWNAALGRRPAAFVFHLPRRGTARAVASVTPCRRGIIRLSGVCALSRFPVGLVSKAAIFAQEHQVVIRPRVVALSRRGLGVLLRADDRSARASSRRGRSDDFYGLRDYAPGDSMRLVAWRSSARTGELVVRENTSSAARRLWVVLQIPIPVESEEAERAITLAASLAREALASGMPTGLAVPQFGVGVRPAQSARQEDQILESLGRLDVRAERPAHEYRAWNGLSPRDSVVVVHAGAVDPSFGPPGAMHLGEADLERLMPGTALGANPPGGGA